MDGIPTMKDVKVESGTVVSVEHVTSPVMPLPDGNTLSDLPPRAIIKLALTPAPRSNINVEIWLPEPGQWSGRFLGLGNGGSAGGIDPVGFTGHIRRGYAVATTDMGTAPDPDSGIGNPEVWKDFGFRATHLMTVTSKQLVREFYGKPPRFSYFLGGSTGGQQALQEAQRYPGDYDGVVAMVPAHCRTPLHAYFLWNFQVLQQCPFTETQEAGVVAAANVYMAPREVPATAGKMVSDPRCTADDIEAVIALAMQRDPTLTAKHADALRKLFGGPRNPATGERIFDGVPLGSTFSNAAGHLYLFRWVFGEHMDPLSVTFDEDIDTYTRALGPYLNAEDPDLSGFEARGGRLIMASGTADSVVPYHATLDYYERVIDRFGSIDRVQEFFRYYVLPGRDHGGGGPGINQLQDMLELVSGWREKGEVPKAINGERVVEGEVRLSMPVYPYPQKTGWSAAAGFAPIAGPRGGVSRVAPRFRPAPAE
jgi:feruloyl esterase